LITPLAVDQFFWGKRMEMLGVSPRSVPQRSLTVESLISGLKKLENAEMKQQAQHLSKLINAEDGVRSAAGIIKNAMS